MNLRPLAVIQIPNQRLFSTRAAAQYLGVSDDTSSPYADEGLIPDGAGDVNHWETDELI